MTKSLESEFKKIVDEHKSTIYSVCYMYSNDPDEVNDLFQETLVKVWQGLPSFKGNSSMKTWIWRITLNTCISADRKKKMKTVPLTMDINLFEDSDANTRQVNMLKERISKLRYFDRHRAAVAGEYELRRDSGCGGHHLKTSVGATFPHQRATQTDDQRLKFAQS